MPTLTVGFGLAYCVSYSISDRYRYRLSVYRIDIIIAWMGEDVKGAIVADKVAVLWCCGCDLWHFRIRSSVVGDSALLA